MRYANLSQQFQNQIYNKTLESTKSIFGSMPKSNTNRV